MNAPIERKSPNNLDAEQGLLAACMAETGLDVLMECVAQKFTAEYFYRPSHQIIYDGLLRLYAKGIPAEEILLANELNDKGELEAVGGHAYIIELTGRFPSTIHVKHWIKVVRDHYFLRAMIRAANWTVEKVYDSKGDVDELMNDVEAEFMKIQGQQFTDSMTPTPKLVDEVGEMINNTLSRRGVIGGVPSGLVDLDAITDGFHEGEMIVLGARPSLGKTALAINIAENVLFPHRRDTTRTAVPTMIFSLEMTAKMLVYRMACSRARVDMQRLREGFCPRRTELAEASMEISRAPLYIDASPIMTSLQIRATARRIHQKHKLGLIIVDYAQLVKATTDYGSREQEVAEVSRSMKALARELNLPVLVLCQLSRESEKQNRLPRLSDLRESGALEADADVVLMLSKPTDDSGEGPDFPVVKRVLVVAKNRNGPIGEIELCYQRCLTKFENYTAHAS